MHCLGQPVCDMVSEGLPRELVFSKRVHLSDFPLQMVSSCALGLLSNFSVLCYNCLRIRSVSFHPRHFLRQQSYRFLIWQMTCQRSQDWRNSVLKLQDSSAIQSRVLCPTPLPCGKLTIWKRWIYGMFCQAIFNLKNTFWLKKKNMDFIIGLFYNALHSWIPPHTHTQIAFVVSFFLSSSVTLGMFLF